MRPTIDETMLEVAVALAQRGTCIKMQCGCVLTDARGRILATGYNGVASGQKHCNEPGPYPREVTDAGSTKFRLEGNRATAYPFACAGAGALPGADLCEAVHAEQNALTWCKVPDLVWTCYLTVSPCMRCAKQLLNTSCKRIVFLEEYTREPQARRLWEESGREWILQRQA